MGLGATEVSKLWRAGLARRERRVRIWQYVTGDCVLDLLIRPPVAMSSPISSRARPNWGGVAAATCIAGVVRRR